MKIRCYSFCVSCYSFSQDAEKLQQDMDKGDFEECDDISFGWLLCENGWGWSGWKTKEKVAQISDAGEDDSSRFSTIRVFNYAGDGDKRKIRKGLTFGFFWK